MFVIGRWAWGGLGKYVVSQVVGNITDGHLMSKNCLEVFPSRCQGRLANGFHEFVMIAGHKEGVTEDNIICSPLKAFQIVNLRSAQVTTNAVQEYSGIGLTSA